MNDQSQMMNQQQQQMMSQPPHMMSQPLPQVMNLQILGQMNQPQPLGLVQSQPMLNQPLMLNSRSYKPNHNLNKQYQIPSSSKLNNFAPLSKQSNRGNWKGKTVTGDKRSMKDSMRRTDKPIPNTGIAPVPSGAGGYKPPTLNELQSQNRLKARKFYSKKKFNNRFAPYAPRNTTSFIIRAKKAGGIASLVSPCPVTPAVLPTPIFSPSREVLGDMAKEEWGVDGYGSMKGLIRLRSPGNEMEAHDDEEEEEGASSESDVEEHVEVERRLDHDLSRFEMIYPNYGGVEYHNVLENRVDDQDTHIAQLEEENLTLKERLFLMERELGYLRRRLQFLERQNQVVEDVNEEVVENGSDNDSEGGSDVHAVGGENNEMSEHTVPNQDGRYLDTEENHPRSKEVCMKEVVPEEGLKNECSKVSKGEEGREMIMHDQEMTNEDESKIAEEGVMVTEKQYDISKPAEAARSELGDIMPTEEHSNESRPEEAVQSHKMIVESDANESMRKEP